MLKPANMPSSAETGNPVSGSPDHYSRLKPEPIEVIEAWGLNFPEGCILKYLARYKFKGESVRDLRKIAWYANRIADRIEGTAGDPPPQV